MAKELIYRVKIVYDSDQAAKGAQTIDRTQEQAKEAVDDTTAAIRRQQEAQENTTRSTRSYHKAQSNANQTLFTFGDLLNDSQQFQFGFAQGSRAIGNNIGFAAEQFANIQQQTGSFRGSIKALGASLLGPGGLILGINLVVTALTVFGDKLFSAEKATEEFNKDLKTTTEFFEELSKAAVDDFLGQADNIEEKLGVIDDALNKVFFAQGGEALLQGGLVDPLVQFNTAAADASNTIQNQLQPATKNVLDNVSEQEIKEALISEEVQKILLNKKAELEAQKVINKFARERLSIEEELERITADRVSDISIQLTGGEAITPEQQKQIEEQRRAREEEQRKQQEALNNIVEASGATANSISEASGLAMESATDQALSAQDQLRRITVLADVASQAVSTLFGESKAAAIASAIINGAQAITKTFAEYGPTPIGFALAGTMTAMTAAQIAKISSTELGGGASGGGGTGGRGSFADGGGSASGQSTSRRRITGGVQSQAQKQPQPIIIQGDINTVATAFKVRKGEAKIRAQQQ